MNSKACGRTLWIVLLLGLNACAVKTSMEFQPIALPAELAESSGLVCDGEDFISFNDSGGQTLLYRFNASGHIVQQLSLAVPQIDWEASASDGRFLYLADTGNNAGKRLSLLIHKVPLDWASLAQPYSPVTLEILLPSGSEALSHQHDLDFEALVHRNNSLWLFSKSWASGTAKGYRLDPELRQQPLGQAVQLPSAGFLVTDAGVDPVRQDFWLVGYTNPFKALWAYLTHAGFEVQLAHYDAHFQLLAAISLPVRSQVEGLCIDQHQQLWLSAEAGKHNPALLINTGISTAEPLSAVRTGSLKTQ